MGDNQRSKVHFASRFNQIKKKMKRWKRPLWSFALIILVLSAIVYGFKIREDASKLTQRDDPSIEQTKETFMSLHVGDKEPSPATQHVMKQLSEQDSIYTVVYRKQYICGDVDQIAGQKTVSDIIQLVLEHPEWEAVIDEDGRVVLEQVVNEMSESCKEKAYIGLDSNGNLSLFDGDPKEDNAIRTFFQLDIESMESSLPPQVIKQLHDGIRISDLDEYNSVISTFSDYAVEVTTEEMRPSEEK